MTQDQHIPALSEPFSGDSVRQDVSVGGFMPRYVPMHMIIDRLNSAVGHCGWSFSIVQWQVMGQEVVVLGRLTVRGVSKEQFGGVRIRMSSGGPNNLCYDLKAAASDSLRKCASLFGVCLELYADNESVIQGGDVAMSPGALAAKAAQAAQATSGSPAQPFQIQQCAQVMMAAGYHQATWFQVLGLQSPNQLTNDMVAAILGGVHPAVHGRVQPRHLTGR